MKSPVFTLHASAVATEGNVLVFIGPSGAGKTTIARLLAPYTEHWADDRVCLRLLSEDIWGVADATSKFPDKSSLIEIRRISLCLDYMPLRAIFVIHKDKTTYLRKIPEIESVRLLMASCYELVLQQHYKLDVRTKQDIFTDMASMIRVNPVYHLHFEMRPHVFSVLDNEFDFSAKT